MYIYLDNKSIHWLNLLKSVLLCINTHLFYHEYVQMKAMSSNSFFIKRKKMSAIPSSPHMKIIVTRGGIKMIELTKKPAAIENSHLYYLNIIKLSGTRETSLLDHMFPI